MTTENPTYIAHPANLDKGETFSIVFKGNGNGKLKNKSFFVEDGGRTGRLLAWLCTEAWANAFILSFSQAREDLFEDEKDWSSLEDFVGEVVPVETIETYETKWHNVMVGGKQNGNS